MRNFKFSMPIRLVSLVVALLLLISIFPMSIFAIDKDVADVSETADVAEISEQADVAEVSEEADVAPVSEEIAAGFYLVGQLNGQSLWNNAPLTNDRMLVENPGCAGEYMLTWEFCTGDELKVVYYDGTEIKTWYPDGNNYVVTSSEAGNNTIYFRPNGNSNWSNNYFTLVKKTPVIDNITYLVDNNKLTLDPNDNDVFSWTNNEVKVRFTVADGYTVSVDGATVEDDNTYKCFIVDCNSGEYLKKSYKITAEKDGITEIVTTPTICIDKAAPVISDEVNYYVQNNEFDTSKWTNQNVTVKFKVTDGGSGVKTVKVNGKTDGVKNNGDGTYSYTVNTDYNGVLTISAADEVGNLAEEKETAVIGVDKSAPKIDVVNYYVSGKEFNISNWTNQDVTVKFKVTDNGSGVNTVNVNGKPDGVKNNGDGTYSYIVEVEKGKSHQNEIKISAKDNVGIESTVDTRKILINKKNPVISEVKYYVSGEEFDISKWTNEDVTVKVYLEETVHGEGNVWVNTEDSNIEFEYVNDEKAYVYTIEVKDKETYQEQLIINAKDNAGNDAESVTTKQINIDKIKPVAEAFVFQKNAKTVLNILTFGVYSSSKAVQVTVRAKDEESGIKSVALYWEDEKIDNPYIEKKLENMVESGRRYVTFTLNGVYTNLNAKAVDNAGNESEKLDFSSGNKYFIATDNEATIDEASFDEASLDQTPFKKTLPNEIVVSDEQPEISLIHPDETTTLGKMPWYNSDVKFDVKIEAPKTKLKDVKITLDGNDITKDVIGDKAYSEKAISIVEGTYTVTENGEHTITVTAQSNNNTPVVTKSCEFSIDKDDPIIEIISYEGLNGEKLTSVDGILPWTNKAVVVNFKVTDEHSGVDRVLVNNSLDGVLDNKDGSYSYIVDVEDSGSVNELLSIYAEDNVGLTDEETTSTVRIDKINPEVKIFIFENTADKVISFLTFGIYSYKDINVVVKANDAKHSSGIESLALYAGDKEIDSKTYDGTSSKITETFKLTEDTYTDINAIVTDSVGNSCGYVDMNNSNIFASPDEENPISSPNEIVVSGEQPEISITYPEPKTTLDKMPWYNSDVKFDVKIEAPKTKLKDVKVELDGNDITKDVIGNKAYSEKATSTVEGTYTVTKNGRRTITVTAQSNNNTPVVTKSCEFSIDKIHPEIDDIQYYTLSTVLDEKTKEEKVVETPISNSSDLKWVGEDVRVKFTVKEQGSGINAVKIDSTELEPTSVDNYGVYSYSYDVKVAYAESFSKKFEIYAEDNVGFTDEETTSTVRIDKIAPQITNIQYYISGDKQLTPVDDSLPWTNENVVVVFDVIEEHSGIQEVTIGYGENNTKLEPKLISDGVYSCSYIMSVPNGYSFDQKLEIYAKDNVANDSKLNTAVINIDKIAPTIEVQYDNPDHKVYQGNEYYKANRTATITVVERNFDPNKFMLDITNTDGSIPALSGWNTVEAGDQSKHTATVTFANDGDYTMTMDCTDAVGNKADVKPKMQKFTIDKTLPTVDVTFDNNSALNNAYYSSDRTATITINEHNFAVDAEHLTVNVTATAGDNTTSVTPPAVVDWSHSGDVHTARIHFTEDGSYEITVDFKDFAYNKAEQFVVDKFYIDETKPEIKFNQVENNVAYGGVIAPQVIMTDNNYDTYTTFTLQRIDIDSKAMDVELYRSSVSNGDLGETITYSNFPEVELNDGIYKLTVRIVDKAGNEDSKEIVFSVNRFGSTYMAGDENTSSLIADGYTNAEQDIVIKEINVNKVSAQKMSLALNNANILELVANKDYSVRTIGGENSWYEYSYTILKENFKEEGFYTLTLSSTDRVKHTVSNRTALTDERKYPVSFTVDKTLPGIRITGVESNKPYKDAQRDVKVVYEDANIDPEKMTIKLNGEILKAGEDYELNTDNAGEAVASFKVKAVGKNAKQNIEVVVIDKADNENTLSVSDFILSASWFRRFLANTPLAITVFSFLGVGIILLIVLLAKKRKQEE